MKDFSSLIKENESAIYSCIDSMLESVNDWSYDDPVEQFLPKEYKYNVSLGSGYVLRFCPIYFTFNNGFSLMMEIVDEEGNTEKDFAMRGRYKKEKINKKLLLEYFKTGACGW